MRVKILKIFFSYWGSLSANSLSSQQVPDPWHISMDPDPRIRTSDQWIRMRTRIQNTASQSLTYACLLLYIPITNHRGMHYYTEDLWISSFTHRTLRGCEPGTYLVADRRVNNFATPHSVLTIRPDLGLTKPHPTRQHLIQDLELIKVLPSRTDFHSLKSPLHKYSILVTHRFAGTVVYQPCSANFYLYKPSPSCMDLHRTLCTVVHSICFICTRHCKKTFIFVNLYLICHSEYKFWEGLHHAMCRKILFSNLFTDLYRDQSFRLPYLFLT